MNYKTLTPVTLIGLILAGSNAYAADAPKLEKCTGIVKAGKADGQSTVNGKLVNWIKMPAGQCIKFVGGKVVFDNK